MRHAAHYLKANTVEKNECPNCRTTWKQHLQQFVPEHDHIASLKFIQIIEPAAFLERD